MTAQPAELNNQILVDVLMNSVQNSAAIAAGTTAGTIKTTVAMNYTIAGQNYSKAVTDNIAVTATGAVASGTTTYYLFCINAAGTVVSVAPPTPRTGDPDTIQLLLGQPPAGYVPFVATAAYTPGTTAIGAQGTFANIARMPRGEVTDLTFA